MKPALHTQQLTIGYHAPRKASTALAESLTLSLHAGELVCLLGVNGIGKSTLMRTLAGMHAPLSGQVFLGNDNLAILKPAQIAKKLSVVLTERPNVGLMNGYALVALGRQPYTNWLGRLASHDEAMIRWAVDAVGATSIAEQPFMSLSDGQKQKLMIARALAQETDIILLDEPTAFLDLPRRVETMQLLRQLAKETGRAILLSTHDLDLALRTADTLWLMAEGTVQVGTPEDLILSGTFEVAFHAQGVHFDRDTGAFSIERTTQAIVCVNGRGVVRTWTERALTRAGFQVASSGTIPAFTVDIDESDSTPLWHLCDKGIQTTHTSIASLLNVLLSTATTKQMSVWG